MTKISTSSFQKGIFIEFKGESHQIIEFQFINPGKGSAFVRTKLKNIKTTKVQEYTFKSGETVEEIPINIRELQYLYKDNLNYIFMDRLSYEQYSLSQKIVGDFAKFIKEGEIYQIYLHRHEAIGMRYPKKVKLLVQNAEEAVKGSTVMGAKKIVILESGAKIAVPLFIKTGDLIAVDPQTGEYVERVSR